jgi:hypothetical protein
MTLGLSFTPPFKGLDDLVFKVDGRLLAGKKQNNTIDGV